MPDASVVRTVDAMKVLESARRDLLVRGRPIGRRELPLLAAISLITVVAAQLNEPGTAIDLMVLVVAGIALVSPAIFGWVPGEVIVTAVAVPVCLVIGREGHLELALFLIATATLYASWYLGSTIRSLLIVVVCSGGVIAASLASDNGFSWLPWVSAEILLFVIGRTLRQQDLLVSDLEAARSALADQAVADERRRIARELHDVAGHTLAAVMLHVTGARHVLRRDVDEAERALLDAEAVGRASMDQIRATVESLRTSERGIDPPLPTADRLEPLVEEYRRAGLIVEATIDAQVGDLGGELGLAIHRIAREALANVARHAPKNRMELVASIDDDTVYLECSDHGQPAGPTTGRPSNDRGFGIIGMTERARSVGGDLTATPTADGWSVIARLPVDLPIAPQADRGGTR